jgi:pimeloyl-ACP methyl ester carboxylesterase
MQSHKKMLFVAAMLVMAFSVSAQPNVLEGHWEGAITRLGAVQPLKFDFIPVGDSLTVQFDDPAQGYYQKLLEDRDQKIGANDTFFDINFGYGKFHCLVNREYLQITGFNKSWKPEVLFHLRKIGEKEPLPYEAEDISFMDEGIKLAGSIYTPRNMRQYPLVILIHGSDAQTRKTPYIRGLVYTLTKNNIGVVVYDKRGAGASGGDAQKASFADLSADVSACIQYIKKKKDPHISKIGLFATSAGGWIAPGIANKWGNTIEFVILNVGPAVPTFQQDIDRIAYTLRSNGIDEKTIDSAIQHSRLYFSVVKNNAGWEQLQQSVALYKTRKWAVEEGIQMQLPSKMNDSDMVWWRTHDFDPGYDLSHMKCRVLSIMSEKDVLVPPATNRTLMEQYLAAAGCVHKLIVLPNAGHNNIAFQTLVGGEWKWPEHFWVWPQRPAMDYNEIIRWIKG